MKERRRFGLVFRSGRLAAAGLASLNIRLEMPSGYAETASEVVQLSDGDWLLPLPEKVLKKMNGVSRKVFLGERRIKRVALDADGKVKSKEDKRVEGEEALLVGVAGAGGQIAGLIASELRQIESTRP